jgi:hypothetical protein
MLLSYTKLLFIASTDEHPEIDCLAADWPVPTELADEMSALITTHEVQPLRVYKDDEYIQPNDVNNLLKGALIEIHFSLKHYCIFRKTEGLKVFDSFSATIEQIVVLKAGENCGTSFYKRKNMLDGPYHPKPFYTAEVHVNITNTTEPAAGTSGFSDNSPQLLSASPTKAAGSSEAFTSNNNICADEDPPACTLNDELTTPNIETDHIECTPKVTKSTDTATSSSFIFSNKIDCSVLDHVPGADVTPPIVAKEKPEHGSKKTNNSASSRKDSVVKTHNMSDKAFSKTKASE